MRKIIPCHVATNQIETLPLAVVRCADWYAANAPKVVERVRYIPKERAR